VLLRIAHVPPTRKYRRRDTLVEEGLAQDDEERVAERGADAREGPDGSQQLRGGRRAQHRQVHKRVIELRRTGI
jgi:hypothetical protein